MGMRIRPSIFDISQIPGQDDSLHPSWRTSNGERPIDPNLQWVIDRFIDDLEVELRKNNDNKQW